MRQQPAERSFAFCPSRPDIHRNSIEHTYIEGQPKRAYSGKLPAGELCPSGGGAGLSSVEEALSRSVHT